MPAASHSDTPPSAITGESLRHRLVEFAAAAVLLPVLLPLVIVFAPTLYLESDPRLSPAYALSAISFGPTGSVWLATVSVLIAGGALGITSWAGGRVRWWSCALVAIGIVPCLVHLPEHMNNRLHGSAWIAAASLGLAAAHLAQFKHAKRLMLSALLAIIVPMCLQAVWYVYVEHPATWQAFHDNLAENLARRGLVEGSPEAAKYLTRLGGNDVIGAVGMSNVFGSIVAAITVLTLGVLAMAFRRRVGVKRCAVLLVLLGMGLWTLMLTQSRGAALALVMVVGLGLCAVGLRLVKVNIRRVLPWLCVLFVLSGVGGVVVRGMVGPPQDHHGERSLLFRYHYWQGAAQMIVDEPSRILLGVGQGPFKDEYETVRNPISPEVVSSTHNVFVDYIVMLGLGGAAWCLLLLSWLWGAGLSMSDGPSVEIPDTHEQPVKPPLVPVGLLAAVVFLIQYAVQFPGLYAETAILWLVGAAGFVGAAVYGIYPVVVRLNNRAGIAVALASVLILLHAQIEMTFFWDAAAAFVWMIVALASAKCQDTPHTQSKPLNHLPAAVLICLGIVLSITLAAPTATHQTRLRRAGEMLTVNPVSALRELDQASTVIPNDPTTLQWRISLRGELAAALIEIGRIDQARVPLDQAWAVLDEAQQNGMPELWLARRRGRFATTAYRLTDNRDWLVKAEHAYARSTKLSPNGLNDFIYLADTQWQLGLFDQASTNYIRALQINDNYYLDPDTQLPEAERALIELRIK